MRLSDCNGYADSAPKKKDWSKLGSGNIGWPDGFNEAITQFEALEVDVAVQELEYLINNMVGVDIGTMHCRKIAQSIRQNLGKLLIVKKGELPTTVKS